MPRLLLLAAILVTAPIQTAPAQDKSTPVVQHAVCENAVVCATMHDGRSVAVTDCKARAAGAVRYLYGDCEDED